MNTERTSSGRAEKSDSPITSVEQDLLGFDAHAGAIAELIDDPDRGGRTIVAINGSAGSGKTSVGNLVEGHLRRADPERPILRFDAWMHDDAENLSAAVLTRLILAVDDARSVWLRTFAPLPFRLAPPGERLKRWLPLVVFVSGITALLGGLFYSLFPDNLAAAVTGAGGLAVIGRAASTRGESLAAFVKSPARLAGAGQVGRVRRQLSRLLNQATRKRGLPFILMIDDLDRCRPPSGVDVLEAVDQLVHGDVAVILLVDLPALAACAEVKYADLAERYPGSGSSRQEAAPEDNARQYGRHYLDRLLPLQLDLPARSPDWGRALLHRRLRGKGQGLIEALEPHLGALPPRKMKRVLARFLLGLRIADKRGLLGEDSPIDATHLAKWTVLQERWPRVASEVLEQPDRLGLLEDAASEEDRLLTELTELDLQPLDLEDLAELLSAAPELGPVVRSVALFEAS